MDPAKIISCSPGTLTHCQAMYMLNTSCIPKGSRAVKYDRFVIERKFRGMDVEYLISLDVFSEPPKVFSRLSGPDGNIRRPIKNTGAIFNMINNQGRMDRLLEAMRPLNARIDDILKLHNKFKETKFDMTWYVNNTRLE